MRITLAAALTAVVLGMSATPACALGLTAGSGASLMPFRPGQTATGSGSLTVIDLTIASSWTLTVSDAGTGAGHMVKAAGPTCTGSDGQLTNALTVTVPSSGVATSAGLKTISGTATTVSTGTTTLTLGIGLATNYSQTIPASQVMLTGCVYSLTATYTLQ